MESVRSPATSGGQTLPSTIRDRSQDAGGSIRWTIVDGWTKVISGRDTPDWLNLDRDRRATLVKSNPNRRVWRVAVGDRVLYVKEFVGSSIADTLRNLLRGGPALREWRAAQAAVQRNVPCVRFVAYGMSSGRGWLVSEEMAGGTALSDAWLRACGASDRRPPKQRTDVLATAAARLLARAHASGLVHGDDHPRNMVVVTADDGSCTACYLDLQRARIKGHVSERLAADSLGQLHQWFQLRASRSQRLRFLRTYCRERAIDHPEAAGVMMRTFASAVPAATHAQAVKLWAKRDRRIGGTNSYFARLRLDRSRRASVPLRFRQGDRFPSPSMSDRTADEWRAVLNAFQVNANGVPNSISECRSTAAGLLQRVRRLFGRSPQRRAFVMGHRLRNRDLPCRWPLAIIEGTTPGREPISRVWLDANPTTVDLVSFLEQRKGYLATRRQICTSLGRLVSLMADRGASVPRATNSTFGVAVAALRAIIDEPLDVVLQARDVQRDRVVTAGALYILVRRGGAFSRTDGVRFLKALSPRDWKHLWQTIERYHRP